MQGALIVHIYNLWEYDYTEVYHLIGGNARGLNKDFKLVKFLI